MDNTNSSTARRLTISVALILVLSFCLGVTSFALVYSMVQVENNLFQTGTVQINLNDGKAVIEKDEFLFEPGMTVKKDFFVENQGTCEIYYKLYFQNVSGGLASALQIEIRDGDKLLLSGTPAQLSRKNVVAVDDTLAVGERRSLQIYFHFPEEIGNGAQGLELKFDFAADAVQTKNNPNKEF